MPRIIQGRVVYALDALPDTEGRNPKPNRPCIVVSDDNASLSLDDLVTVICVSRSVHGKDEEVPLPHGPNCRHGFPNESAAICNWGAKIPKSRLDVTKRILRPTDLRDVLIKHIEYREQKRVIWVTDGMYPSDTS